MKTCQFDNKTKHPKKGGEKGTRWKDPSPGKRRNHQMGQTVKVHEQIKYSNLVAVKSISNKERQGTPKIRINS